MPRAQLVNSSPHVRLKKSSVISVPAVPATSFGGPGYPIGMLLSITYIKSYPVAAIPASFTAIEKPKAKIK